MLHLTSIRTGLHSLTAILRASAVALYTPRASPPSTLMLAMPYEGPLPAIPSPAHTHSEHHAGDINNACLVLHHLHTLTLSMMLAILHEEQKPLPLYHRA